MQLTLRKLAPAFAALALVPAGCKTAPTQKADTDSAGTTQPQPSQQSAAAAVEFYVAQPDQAPGLMAVAIPAGALHMQGQPVPTRSALAAAAALVDRQGQNFVGLRFTEEGARKLSDISSKNIGNMLALVMDRELVAAPRIAEPL